MLLDLRIFEKVTKHAKTTFYLFRASCFCTELRLLTQTSRLPRSRTVSPNFVLHRKKLKNWSSFLAMIRNVKPLSNHLNKKDSVTRFSTLFYHKILPRPQTVWTDKKVTKNVILYFQKLCVCVVIDYTDTSWNSCWLMRTWCQQIHWPCGRGCWKHGHGVSVVNENEDMVSA